MACRAATLSVFYPGLYYYYCSGTYYYASYINGQRRMCAAPSRMASRSSHRGLIYR
jgi:hypothetical protein